MAIETYLYATSQLAQTTLRAVLGEVELDELLADREKINGILKRSIDEHCATWGIEVEQVAVKDVVLPRDRKRQLVAIAGHVRDAAIVLEDWGFARELPHGRGVAALFTGPSGTGKTMAAQALANELGLDLYAVDLARVVSKYIGETEKNLDAVFDEAEAAQAVLLFDEADALFG